MPAYSLPNCPDLTSPDPLGICSLDDKAVPQIQLLTELINKASDDLRQVEQSEGPLNGSAWTTRFRTLLDDIAYSLHGEADLDTAGLPEANLGGARDRAAFRKNLFCAALQLEALFPDGTLLHLSEENEAVTFSTAQVDCLLAHMFLGTLLMHSGNVWGRTDFTQYYSGKMMATMRNTALPYLDTIVEHFRHRGYASDPRMFTFHYAHAGSMPEIESCALPGPMLPVTSVDHPTDPSDRGDDTFVLVAANAEPGPGAGGTHEERLVGQSPALAIVSLLTPMLATNAAVLTSPLPIHALWEGHGREAKLISLLLPAERPLRAYIVADALPLDLSHRQSDLLRANVNREVRKLYAAFIGARQMWEAQGRALKQMTIEMPPWGCGAFGGNLKTKMPCMAIAAGLAGLTSDNLVLLVPREREHELWQQSVRKITVAQVYKQMVEPNGITATLLNAVRRMY